MSEPIIVAGRECHFTDAGDDAPSWVITSKPFGESGDFLKPSGRWERDIAAGEVYGWPTEAAAREFASSLAARSQPAEGADGWPINAKDAAGIAIHAAAALARFSNWGDLPPELSSAMCRKAVEIRDALAALKSLPTPPVARASAALSC